MLWDGPLIAKLLEKFKENRVLWDVKHPSYIDKATKDIALNGIKEELGLPLSTEDIYRKFKTMKSAYQCEIRNIKAAKLRGFYYRPTLHWFDHFHKFMEETTGAVKVACVPKGKKARAEEQNSKKRTYQVRQRNKYVITDDDGSVEPVNTKKRTHQNVSDSGYVIVEDGSVEPANTKKRTHQNVSDGGYVIVEDGSVEPANTKKRTHQNVPDGGYVIIDDGTVEPARKRKPWRSTVECVVPERAHVVPEIENADLSEVENSADESEDEFQTFADHIAEQLRSMSVHRAVLIQNQIQRLFAVDKDMYGDDGEHYMIS